MNRGGVPRNGYPPNYRTNRNDTSFLDFLGNGFTNKRQQTKYENPPIVTPPPFEGLPYSTQNTLNPTRTTQPLPNNCFTPQYGSPASTIYDGSIFFSYETRLQNGFKVSRNGPHERAWC